MVYKHFPDLRKHFKKCYRVIFHVNNAEYLVKWMEKSVQDISKGKISDIKY